MNFTEIAKRYEKIATIQSSASEVLFELLKINASEDVLDIGCGSGNLTARIREITDEDVVGIDPSHGMIDEAQAKYQQRGIKFYVNNVETIDYSDEFDVVFCNSTFQWFQLPETAIRRILQALKPGGRVGIQAPATREYCPNFIKAISAIAGDSRTAEVFSHFKNPWLFFETAMEYQQQFESVGFDVGFATIETIETEHSPGQVFDIFSSGAIAGYLNPDFYDVPFASDYPDSFKEIVWKSFEKQADERGVVKLVFHRIYLIAFKP